MSKKDKSKFRHRIKAQLLEEMAQGRRDSKPAPAPENAEAPLDATLGLCCNCENRGSCTLQNSPGGVWHCEEYR